MASSPQQSMSPYPPPESAALMRKAIEDFGAKSLEEQVEILKRIGILGADGELAPEYRHQVEDGPAGEAQG